MSEPDFPENFLIFGCGNMGGAMLRGWINAGIAPERFTVIDPYANRLPNGVQYYPSAASASEKFHHILLAIKPQALPKLAAELVPLLAPNAQLISILAGTLYADLAAHFPGAEIVRLMPNLAASIGKSPLALWTSDLAAIEKLALENILSALGKPIWLDAEAQMDAVTALAGSGPAFVYRFIDALTSAGIALGLSVEQANQMAVSMTEGAALLAAQSDEGPRDLAARVTSPGGTTAAGLAILDQGDALQHLMAATLKAAAMRSAQLAIASEGAKR